MARESLERVVVTCQGVGRISYGGAMVTDVAAPINVTLMVNKSGNTERVICQRLVEKDCQACNATTKLDKRVGHSAPCVMLGN